MIGFHRVYNPITQLKIHNRSDFSELRSLLMLIILSQFYYCRQGEKSPNEFALKAGIEYLNEIRLSVGEGQESIMDDNRTLTGQ